MTGTALFRGKTVGDKWVYGSLIIAYGDYYILEREEDVHPMDYPYVDDSTGIIDGHITPVIKDTVGQYVGFNDKHDNPIFDGDVLDTPRWIVTYCSNLNAGLGMNAGWYIQRDDFESWSELDCEPYHEVLGNIWDNPELLAK